MFVATRPTSNLCATWIAFRGHHRRQRAVAYVPGSHRLPWFEFEPGTVVCKQSVGRERRAEFASWVQETIREKGLERRAFTCKRGDAFIWHGGLVHGGDSIENPERTRKSFVVHYTTAADYTSRTARMEVRDGTGWRRVARTTETIVERDGARGLDAPLRESVGAV
jgi:phytanoyl-CoA hydroxylase